MNEACGAESTSRAIRAAGRTPCAPSRGPSQRGRRRRRRRRWSQGRSRPAATVAAVAGGRVVFRGRVESIDWEERDGFTWSELELAGEAADAGSSCRIWSKNENPRAWRDGAPDVTAPDLICCLSAATGAPVTNPHHEAGAAVDVVGVPAAPQWRTPAGFAALGLRHFGLDVDCVPLEECRLTG